MSKRGRRTSEHAVESRRQRVWIGIAAFAGVAALAAILMLQPAAQRDVDDAHDPFIGAAGAPVTVYYFADFQCPYCQAFELGNFEGLRADYFETGKARFVFKDFAILGDDSWAAAQASQHVWTTTPELYWTWHRAIYEAQGAERSGWASPSRLVALSAQVEGVEADTMLEAISEDRYLAEARDDKSQGDDAGVRSTPTLLIEGARFNAQDDLAVRAAIEEALAS